MIVVDANLLVYFEVETEHSPMAKRVWAIDSNWHTARLWRSEFRNALVKYMRVGYITLERATAAFRAAERVLAKREYEVDSVEILALAANSACSAYDCEYVALALRLEVPLVTADRRVLREFPDVAVSLETFARGAG